MKRSVKDIQEALEVLNVLCLNWVTVNKIENNLWVRGVAFFDRRYCRVAYYDEAHNMLSIY
jgi:hypothetical protein